MKSELGMSKVYMWSCSRNFSAHGDVTKMGLRGHCSCIGSWGELRSVLFSAN